METPTPISSSIPSASRLNLSNIIAACIVAIGLVSSARILVQRPAAVTMGPSAMAAQSTPAVYAAQPLASPPRSQEMVREQVRTQILAAPSLQTFCYNKVVYKLSDATVSHVVYSAKEDNFGIPVDLVWLPAMPSGGPQRTYVSLNNNGYNQYIGTVVISSNYGNSDQSADITVK